MSTPPRLQKLPKTVLYIFGTIFLLTFGVPLFFGIAGGVLALFLSGSWLEGLGFLFTVTLGFGGVGGVVFFILKHGSKQQKKQQARHQAILQALPKLFGSNFGKVAVTSPEVIIPQSPYLSHIFGKAPVPTLDIYQMLYQRTFTLTSTNSFSGQGYRTSVEDYLSFELQGTTHYLSELKVEKMIRGENNTTYEPYGTFVVLRSSVDHRFAGTTVVVSEGLFRGWLPRYQKVRLESPEFEECFEVRSTSQQEARVCLKTNVMTAWQDYLVPRSNRGFMEFHEGFVTIGLELKKELFQTDAQSRITQASARYSRQTIEQLLNLTQLLNINHEYLYKS